MQLASIAFGGNPLLRFVYTLFTSSAIQRNTIIGTRCWSVEEEEVSHKVMKRWVTRLLALIATVGFLATSFRAGWKQRETDFPNYYTAAVLVRKGQPLRQYYDWTWFQRQMNYAGIENQLGGYVPQTPVTMFPMVPIAGFSVQTAKRIWLICNVGFLTAAIWLLSCVTHFSIAEISLLAFAGYGALHRNFLLGQYYVFLLFLLVAGFYFLSRSRPRSAGLAFGSACALKLYGAPFLLYFAAKRERRPVAGFIAGALCFLLAAIAVFGWRDVIYFATHILPRTMQGETGDPYNPGNGTISTLLRRTFIAEAELNPHPVFNAPFIFFLLQPLVVLGVLVFPLLAIRKSSDVNRDFAWYFIAMMLASPNVASYTFILLLLPILLLLEDSGALERVVLIASYVLLTLPLRPVWSFLFPKLWLLMFLFAVVGRRYLRFIKLRPAAITAAFIMLAAVLSAQLRLTAYHLEPPQRWERVATERGAIGSSSPAIVRSGIVYESVGTLHYILRWLHGGQIEGFSFDGEALDPVPMSADGPVQFELVAHGTSTTMLLDPVTKALLMQAGSAPRIAASSAGSPDGKWIAFTGTVAGATQIFLRPVTGTKAVSLTGGYCNSSSPAWDLDSKSIVFASDCGRGVGLPSLYRARIALPDFGEAASRHSQLK